MVQSELPWRPLQQCLFPWLFRNEEQPKYKDIAPTIHTRTKHKMAPPTTPAHTTSGATFRYNHNKAVVGERASNSVGTTTSPKCHWLFLVSMNKSTNLSQARKKDTSTCRHQSMLSIVGQKTWRSQQRLNKSSFLLSCCTSHPHSYGYRLDDPYTLVPQPPKPPLLLPRSHCSRKKGGGRQSPIPTCWQRGSLSLSPLCSYPCRILFTLPSHRLHKHAHHRPSSHAAR